MRKCRYIGAFLVVSLALIGAGTGRSDDEAGPMPAQSTIDAPKPAEPAPLALGPTVAPDVAIEIVFARLHAERAAALRTLAQTGRTPAGMNAAAFEKERRRAEATLPLLARVLEGEEAYRAGTPMPVPSGLEPAVEQGVLLLNLLQAHAHGDRIAAKMWSEKIPTGEGLFRARTGATADDQRLTRLLQFTRAELAYHDGDDVRAEAALARLVPGVTPSSSHKGTATPVVKEGVRVGVLPFSPKGGDETLALLEETLVEVMSADLASASTMEIVPRALVRTRSDKIAPALATFLGGGPLAPLRALVPATHLLAGSMTRTPSGVHVTLRLVDSARGLVIVTAETDTQEDTLFDDTDRLLADLFARSPLSAAFHAELLSLDASPDPADARALALARLLQETDEKRAKEHFIDAMRGSPATAFLFTDLVKRFPDARPTIAVFPFSSERGEAALPWQLAGLRAGIAQDLTALGFALTSLAELDRDVVAQKALPMTGSIPDSYARAIAVARGADLALVGSVFADGPLCRLFVRIIHAKSGRLFYTAVVDERSGDLPALLLHFSIALATHFHVIEPDERKTLLEGNLLMGRVYTRSTFETWAQGVAHPTPPSARPPAPSIVQRTLKPGRPLTVPFALGVSAIVVGAPVIAVGAWTAQPFAAHAYQLHGLQQAVVDPRQQAMLRAERDQAALIANLAIGGSALGLALVSVGVATVVIDGWLASRSSIELESTRVDDEQGKKESR
jgi:TolB-like protein